MRLDDFYERLWKKKATVIGIGVSNTPLIKFLKQHGAEVTARDIKPRENFGALADELERDGVKLRLGEDYLEGLDEEFIFRSPGIRPDIPEFEAARARGAVVTSEIEMFLELCPCKALPEATERQQLLRSRGCCLRRSPRRGRAAGRSRCLSAAISGVHCFRR